MRTCRHRRRRPTARWPASTPSTRRRLGRDARQRRGQRNLRLVRPFERQRQQEFEAGRARLGLGERQLLAVVVDRRMVGADRVDRAVGEARAQRVAVARAAQRRHEAALRVEPADVDVAQVQVVDGDVAGDRRGRRASRRAPSRRLRASTVARCARGRRFRAPARRSSPARSSPPQAGIAAQAEPRRDLAVVRDAAAREIGVLRTQPDADSRTSPRTAARGSSTCVSASGASACENATQPASASSPISVRSSPLSPTVSAPTG